MFLFDYTSIQRCHRRALTDVSIPLCHPDPNTWQDGFFCAARSASDHFLSILNAISAVKSGRLSMQD
jgi:hypothetical protein